MTAASASADFLENLRRSGLLSEGKVSELRERLSQDSVEPGVALVEDGILTTFQAQKIREGQVKGLALGQYHLLEELGQGGFGRVYKARHTIMNRIVALKVIAQELVEDSRARKRFRREVLALTDMTHPNIVMAYDANEVDEVLFLVMEYVEGPNLQDLVRVRGPLSIGLACAMLHQTAKALQYAHEKGMVHRDIKPANLLVPQGGLHSLATLSSANTAVLIKVADFGLARLPRQSTSASHESRDRTFVGTPDYAAPEQSRPALEDVDIRSDLYSLGCTFYYALTGRKPFSGKHPLDIILQHLEKDAPSLRSVRPEVPHAVESIVRRLMAKDPEKRFQTPLELSTELTFLLGGELRSQPLGAVAADFTPPPPPEDSLPLTRVPESMPPVTSISLAAEEAMPVTTQLSLPPPAAHEEPTASLANEPAAESPPAPSSPAETLRWDGDFILFWNEWKQTIQTIQSGNEPELNDLDYRQLHARLLEKIQARRLHAVADRQALLARLEDLLEPWLSLDIVAATESTTLADLLQKANELERGLAIQGTTWPTWVSWFVMAIAMASTVVGYWLVMRR